MRYPYTYTYLDTAYIRLIITLETPDLVYLVTPTAIALDVLRSRYGSILAN